MGERPPLTARQREVLSFIGAFSMANGFPPTVREIAVGLGLRSTRSVQEHLARLQGKGYISRVPGISRGIRILKRDVIPR
jgi:repressor LexA